MPQLVKASEAWKGWSVASWEYATSAFPINLIPEWVSNVIPLRRPVAIEQRAAELITGLRVLPKSAASPLSIGLAGHSAGGLAILFALYRLHVNAATNSEDAELLLRLKFITLYGTPVQGSDRVRDWLAQVHRECRDLALLEPSRDPVVTWLGQYQRRRLLILPLPMDISVIATSYLYSPSDEWVGPFDGRGADPMVGESLNVSHIELCKPTDEQDVRFQVLTQAMSLSSNPRQELRDNLAGLEKLIDLIKGAMVNPVNSIGEDVPGQVVSVFNELMVNPPIQDNVNHYEEINYLIDVDRHSMARTTTRVGQRVVAGSSEYLDFQYGAATPLSSEITRSWSATDQETGQDLRLELLPSGNLMERRYRVWFRQPKQAGVPFTVAARVVTPDHDIDGFGCVGLVLQGFTRGVDAVNVNIAFADAPLDIRMFSRTNEHIVATHVPFSSVSVPGQVRAGFTARLQKPGLEHILIAWFRM